MQTKNFADLITFTRATTGTWLNPATGLLETAAINVPRLEAKGLLFEQQRTNLLTYSADYTNAAWQKNDTTISTDGTLAPDGTLMPFLTQGSAGTGYLRRQANISTSAVLHTYSAFMKRGNHDWVRVTLSDTTAIVNGVSVWFNLATGAVGNVNNLGSAVDGSAAILPLSAGVYRIVVAVTVPVSTVNVTENGVTANGSAARVAGGTRYTWGSQIEVGEGPSSYIPTSAAQVTRAQDTAYVTDSGWMRNGEGSLAVEADHFALRNNLTMCNLETVAASGRITLYIQDSGGRHSAFVASDAGNTEFFVTNLGPAVTIGQVTKGAIAYKLNDMQFSTAGQQSPVGGSSSIPAVDRLSLGARNLTTSKMVGHIRRIKYFPYRLTAAELQALTT